MIEKNKMDFNGLNKDHIVILHHQSTESIVQLMKHFKAQGLKVWISNNRADMLRHLEKERPGCVLISRQIDKGVIASIPGFLLRKFQIPVLLFNECGTECSADEDPLPLGIEYLPKLDPAQALQYIRGFHQRYEENWQAIYSQQQDSPLLHHLAKVIKPHEQANQAPERNSFSLFKVLDPIQGGYFVFAFPYQKGMPPPNEAVEVLAKHIKSSLGATAQLEPVNQKFSWDLYQTISKNSDRTVVGFIDSQEMIMSYFGKPQKSNVEENIEVLEDRAMVGIEDWWTEIPLNFDAYMWMEKNNRKFIYVKKGDTLRSESLDRFKKSGYKKMAINKDDVSSYKRLKELFQISQKKAA